MHSFGLTERWLVLAEFPYVVNPPSLAFSGRPYIENYRWRPELGTRFQLFDRTTGESTGPFETDARFGFHHVNAYEDGDDVVVDICTFDDAEIVEDLYLERLRDGKPLARAASRAVHDLHREGHGRHGAPDLRADGAAAHQLRPLQRAAVPLCLGRRQRGQQLARPDREGRRHDVARAPCGTRRAATRASPSSCGAGRARTRTPGVLLSVVFDGRTGNSFLLVLDAASLDEVARAEVPHHIPFGFHGQFARA